MSYTVKLIPSGNTYTVEAGEKILHAGLDAGISLPYSCRMGTCNTCKAHIKEGEFEFGDALPHYLPQEERDRGMALLCQARACSDLVIEVEELPKLVPPTEFTAMVKKIVSLADDVRSIELRLPLHQSLIFASGQYIDLLLPEGERRSYSLANASASPMGVIDLVLHVRHMPGGLFTDKLFDGSVKVRDKFQVEGPLGTFFLREDDKPLVLLASGTGYAPIRSILLEMFRLNDGRKATLYWGGRSKKDIYAMEEVQAWVNEHPNLRFVPVLSDAQEGDEWTGRTGFVHLAVMKDIADLSGHQVYACGAPAMVAAARKDFIEQGALPAGEFFADAFVSKADANVAE
jgi:CDP-4-dehydro-6-deoxyglucose reductase